MQDIEKSGPEQVLEIEEVQITNITELKNTKKSYILALLSCLSFGIGNYITADLSMRVGVLSIFSQSLGMIFTSIIYHSYKWFKYGWKSEYYDPIVTDEASSEASISTSKLSVSKMSAPLFRSLIVFFIHLTHITTFMYASKSGINGGIISTLFSSSCVFTCLIFYFKYG